MRRFWATLEQNLVKQKTLGTGVRIFNGAVRAEREFPLKILFLACIRGFVVLLILRNGDQNLLGRSTNTISVSSVSKYFRIFYSPMSQISSNFRIVLKKIQFFLKTS